MPYELWCTRNVGPAHTPTRMLINTYASQNLARWWGVNMIERGSVSLNMGASNEELVPLNHIEHLYIKEVA